MSKGIFFRLLLAFALVWAGSAAQLHSLAHAQYDLAVAGYSAEAHAPFDKAPAPFKHSTEQCLVVHALDGASVGAATLFAVESSSQYVVSVPRERHGPAPRLAFRSRAPPVLS